MAFPSSSSSSTSQNQDGNNQNELPNSNSRVGSSSDFPNNNEGNDVNNNEKKNSESMLYSCKYCKGQYSTLQALGGHQNAHKAERALKKQQIKQRYEGGTLNFGQPSFNPYLNYPRATRFTPYNYNYRPLGVRLDSLYQKTPHISPRFGHGAFKPYINNHRPRIGTGLGSLSLQDILNPSLVTLRNNIQGSNSGGASLGIGGANTSRTEDEVGTNNPNAAILMFGESSTNNVAPNSTMGDIDNSKSNIEEEPSDSDSSGLDLELKL
jgi:hypothetical protein